MSASRVLAGLVGLFALLVLAGPVPLRSEEDKEEPKFNDIYVPTDVEVIEKMFEMAKVNKKDVVFDLGCGDGRIPALACKKFGCRGIGIDLNPVRIRECIDTITKYEVQDLVTKGRLEYRLGNALKVCDFDQASVVMLYMLPGFMNQLYPIAKARLKPGTRIVSHDYVWDSHRDEWPPDMTVDFQGPTGKHATLYMWTVKGKKGR